MKKTLLFCLMAALAVCGCKKVETKDVVSADKVFTATMEATASDATAVDTKTSLDVNLNVLWNQGDQVSIFAGSSMRQFGWQLAYSDRR